MLREAKLIDESRVSDTIRIDYKKADLELPINETAIIRYSEFDIATAVFLFDEVQDTMAAFTSAASVLRTEGHLICAMLDVNREMERYELAGASEAIIVSRNVVVDGHEVPGELFRVLRPTEAIMESAQRVGLALRLNEVISPQSLNSRSDGPALRILVWQKIL
jgi:hypothetical protein